MPKFRVTNPLGYWDGVHKHKAGTVILLSKEDYKRLLSVDMEPMDPEAKKDMEEFKKLCAPKGPDGKPLPITQWVQTTSGDLNPNDRDDLRAMTPRGAKVVEAPPEVETGHVVRPETASA